MNILPKKSWHVLKKENIDRVRRDEAKAAEEEKQKQARVALAEQESRTARLRDKARKRYDKTVKISSHPEDELAVVQIDDQPKGHINFFKDFQEGKKIGGVNADHEAEKEAEKINYEKKIGLLTYLGQSSAESQTVKPWYLNQDNKHKFSEETDDLTSKTSTVDVKRKKLLDPMEDMNRYLGKKSDGHSGQKKTPCSLRFGQPRYNSASKVEEPFTRSDDKVKATENQHRKEDKRKKNKKHRKNYFSSDDSDSGKKHKRNKSKHKKHRRHSSSSSDSEPSSDEASSNTKSNVSIEKLRVERLRREAAEKARTERLLSGEKEQETPPSLMSVPEKVEHTRGRYNSQFHPELARKQRHKKDYHNI